MFFILNAEGMKIAEPFVQSADVYVCYDKQRGPWNNPRVYKSYHPSVSHRLSFNFGDVYHLNISLNEQFKKKAMDGNLAESFFCCVEFEQMALYFKTEDAFQAVAKLFDRKTTQD